MSIKLNNSVTTYKLNTTETYGLNLISFIASTAAVTSLVTSSTPQVVLSCVKDRTKQCKNIYLSRYICIKITVLKFSFENIQPSLRSRGASQCFRLSPKIFVEMLLSHRVPGPAVPRSRWAMGIQLECVVAFAHQLELACG